MKRLISLICCLSLLLGTISFAANDKLTEGLTDVILKVKAKVDVPKEYSEFDYNFYDESYHRSAYWNLYWKKPDNYERITVSADNEGHIKSYYIRDDKTENSKPVYLKEELKPIADKFIAQIAPEIVGHIEYQDAKFNGTYSGTYTFSYTRVENGILMPENTVTVAINYETGKVMQANINWLYNVEVPNATTKISSDKAAEKIGESLKMKLVYKNRYEDEKVKAYLVYVPDRDYISVDAKTGEIYLDRDEWIDKSINADASMMESVNNLSAGVSEKNAGLTEEEIAKLEELSGLISKQEAIDIIINDKSLLIDENLTTITATLSKTYSSKKDDTNYYWRVRLSDDRKVDYESDDRYRAYANATVDAKTGEIISFDASVKSSSYYNDDEMSNIVIKYNKNQCKEILEKFLKSRIADKFNNSKLSNDDNGYVVKYINENVAVYGGYSYNYNRVNEGIEYTYNNIRGSVDGVTGKIYSFRYNWDDNIEFESPKNAMNAEKAFDEYISKDGFNLVYEINNKHLYNSKSEYKYQDYELEKEIRLVYRPDITPNTISPFTAKQLDASGKEYKKVENYNYKDINGHFAERYIKLAADMEIGPKEELFRPDVAITVEDFNKFLEGITYISRNKEDETAKNLTRAQAIKIIGTDLKKVAELKGIYKVDFNDANIIKEEDLGYIALAKGLGIIKADGNGNFRPYDSLTRAEAICMIMNYVATK